MKRDRLSDWRRPGRSGPADAESAQNSRTGGRRPARRLLTPEILELVPSTARIECVGKRHNEQQVTQQEINRRLCDVRRGRADGRAPERGRRSDLRACERRDGCASRRRHFVCDRARRDGCERCGCRGWSVAHRSPAGIGPGLSDGPALQRQSAAELEGDRRAWRHGRHLYAWRPRGRSGAAAYRGGGRSAGRRAWWWRARRDPTSRSSKRRWRQLPELPTLPAPAILLIGAVPAATPGRADLSKCWQIDR